MSSLSREFVECLSRQLPYNDAPTSVHSYRTLDKAVALSYQLSMSLRPAVSLAVCRLGRVGAPFFGHDANNTHICEY